MFRARRKRSRSTQVAGLFGGVTLYPVLEFFQEHETFGEMATLLQTPPGWAHVIPIVLGALGLNAMRQVRTEAVEDLEEETGAHGRAMLLGLDKKTKAKPKPKTQR